MLGGGGYTIRNVARTWAFETGLAAGMELGASESRAVRFANTGVWSELTSPFLDIPMNEYYEYFGPNYRLDVPQNNTEDLNTPEYLDKIKTQVFENLRHTGGGGGAPSVQMQREWSPLILC